MRALVIDDARAMRLILRQILQKIGFEVTEAADGREGLEQLHRLGVPDIALVDCNMPGMDGFAFLEAVRGNAGLRAMHVIMVTAEDDEKQVAKAFAAGADEYIVKPFNKEMIQEKLGRLKTVATPS